MRAAFILVGSIVSASLAACSAGTSGPKDGGEIAESIAIVGPSQHCCAADTGVMVPLTAVVLGSRGDTLRNIGIAWSSSDSVRVRVDSLGIATTRAYGVAFVRAAVIGAQPAVVDSIEMDVEALN